MNASKRGGHQAARSRARTTAAAASTAAASASWWRAPGAAAGVAGVLSGAPAAPPAGVRHVLVAVGHGGQCADSGPRARNPAPPRVRCLTPLDVSSRYRPAAHFRVADRVPSGACPWPPVARRWRWRSSGCCTTPRCTATSCASRSPACSAGGGCCPTARSTPASRRWYAAATSPSRRQPSRRPAATGSPTRSPTRAGPVSTSWSPRPGRRPGTTTTSACTSRSSPTPTPAPGYASSRAGAAGWRSGSSGYAPRCPAPGVAGPTRTRSSCSATASSRSSARCSG